jgi:hypothetical protein
MKILLVVTAVRNSIQNATMSLKLIKQEGFVIGTVRYEMGFIYSLDDLKP